MQKDRISEELERMVIHKIEFEKEECFEEVSKSLVRMMGDSTKIQKEDKEESYVAEKVERQVSEVMAAYKCGKMNVSVTGVGKEKKPINKKDNRNQAAL